MPSKLKGNFKADTILLQDFFHFLFWPTFSFAI